MPVFIEKQMGITHAEFLRLLPRALGTDDFRVSANSIEAVLSTGNVRIELGPEGERRIALMRMPMTSVKITLDRISEPDVDAFLARFDRAYQRGGG